MSVLIDGFGAIIGAVKSKFLVTFALTNNFLMFKMTTLKAFYSSTFLVTGCFFLFSCEKIGKDSPEMEGTMLKMECFGRWGIKAHAMQSVDSIFYVIPDELNSSFEVEGLEVQFNASLRPNTLPLLFPDPSISPGSIFQGAVSALSEK